MSLDPVIDFEALLSPIPGENPSGENLQYVGLHDKIREARRSDADLDQGEWKRELKVEDWPLVERLASEALAAKTKDLQVAAWLTEAVVHLHGFVGLRDSLRLEHGLLEKFWDTIYPEIDADDLNAKGTAFLEARGNALAWMDRQLAQAVKRVPITSNITGVSYAFEHFDESSRYNIPENTEDLDRDQIKELEDLRQRAAQEGKVTSEQWRAAKNGTNRAFYEVCFATVNETWAAFQELDRTMDEKFARQTPGLGNLKKSLDDIRTLVEKIVKEKRILEPDPVTDAELAGEGGVAGDGGALGVSGAVRTRHEALKRLSEVAEYFRRTEPHSPVSYLVDRAVRWGQMPLDAWLVDVIKDESVIAQLKETLGLQG